jgi:hypothetical protein
MSADGGELRRDRSSTCSVQRRDFPVGDRPTRQLSLQPVAIGAAVGVTKRLAYARLPRCIMNAANNAAASTPPAA